MKLSDIQLQVIWNRLNAIVEEQAQTLIRTAFSTPAREANDLSAGLFDAGGRMIAQAVTGTPGHVNTMAMAIPHFIAEFPIADMKPGDVYVTNDPWKGTGHLSDFTVVTPIFRGGEVIAFFACTTHVVDIGGLGQSPDGKQIYHEGLWVPVTTMMEEGRENRTFFAFLRQNVREPIQVEGDMYALAACNDIGGKRLHEMLDVYGLHDIAEISEFIVDKTRTAMRNAIRALPKGTAQYAMTIDGYDKPIDLVARLTIEDESVSVDYTGTSAMSDFGINCPLNYTQAYTAFGVKCIVAPTIPNNAGSLEVITVTAPEKTIVNAPPPCAVMARTIVGHMLPDVVFGCMHQLLPGRVPAEGCSTLWSIKLGAGHGISGDVSKSQDATPFNVTSFHSGGTGARPTIDGMSATPFPAGVRTVPIEITEAISPIVFWKKLFRQDSGGAGTFRGGLGQVMEISSREDAPFTIFATFDRTTYPARGKEGGAEGALGRVELKSGLAMRGKGRQQVPSGETLVLTLPGGGGYGDPLARDPLAVLEDVRSGFVSNEQARALYGVHISDTLEIDGPATDNARSTR